ncbi:hypothetical protein Tsubulata_034480 [Turnera subulata]|uniref:DNA polymerase delta subunit 4 n=1 Tax=Turnera subulata TaxID=218843 RepID=A0A9Q0G2S4_9ROSI|nr:hypothetical protein Tsubulata_034480 [Turnera subulata]
MGHLGRRPFALGLFLSCGRRLRSGGIFPPLLRIRPQAVLDRVCSVSGALVGPNPILSLSLVPQPIGLLLMGLPHDIDKNENLLRQFDMDMKYRPCIGMTRMARWERACRLGLNPPEEIGSLLKSEKVRGDSLWDIRI